MSESFSDRPGPDRKRSSSAREDQSDQSDAPKLGSLAQAARGKQLNQARGILIAVGILTIVVQGVLIAMAPGQIHDAVEKEIAAKGGRGRVVVNEAKVREVEEQAFRFVLLVDGAAILLGVLFVIFGLIVKMFPLPVTITSLVLYVAATIGFALISDESAKALGQGIVIRILIVIALIKAIQAAWAYEKEMHEWADLRSEH